MVGAQCEVKAVDEAGKMAWGQAGCWMVVQCHAKNLVPDTELVSIDSGKRRLRPMLLKCFQSNWENKGCSWKLSGMQKSHIANFPADGLGEIASDSRVWKEGVWGKIGSRIVGC